MFDDSSAGLLTCDDVRDAITALRLCVECGERAGAACHADLDRLRAGWRARPHLFSSNDVEALRAIAGSLKNEEPDADIVRARKVLQEVFGYPSFRPGQEAIIGTVPPRSRTSRRSPTSKPSSPSTARPLRSRTSRRSPTSKPSSPSTARPPRSRKTELTTLTSMPSSRSNQLPW
jgi:hypothetical protein